MMVQKNIFPMQVFSLDNPILTIIIDCLKIAIV